MLILCLFYANLMPFQCLFNMPIQYKIVPNNMLCRLVHLVFGELITVLSKTYLAVPEQVHMYRHLLTV